MPHAMARILCRIACGACSPAEPRGEAMTKRLADFKRDVILSKLRLLSMLRDLKEKGARVVGISAPSRARRWSIMSDSTKA